MSDVPKVSVVIPTYNRLAYLKQAVDSVLQQTFQDFEIIIVDGVSKDGTGEYVERLREKDDRIRYFSGKESCASAMNKGIEESRGEYIAFLDDDDLWVAESLRTRVEYLDKNQAVQMVFADAEHFQERDGNYSETYSTTMPFFAKYPKPGVVEDLFFLLMANASFIPTITVMARRNIFAEIGGFDEALIYNEDLDMWLRIAAHFKVAALPNVLARRRWHAEMTSANEKKMVVYLERLLKQNLEKFGKQLLDKRQLSEVDGSFARIYFLGGWIHLSEADKKKARSYFMRSLQMRMSLGALLYLSIAYLPTSVFRMVRSAKRKLGYRFRIGPNRYGRLHD